MVRPAQVLIAEQHPPAGDRVAAGEGLHQFGPPGAHQPVQADDLALADVERHVVDRDPAGVRLGDRDALDRQGHVAVVPRLVAEVVVGLPAHHLPDRPRAGRCSPRPRWPPAHRRGRPPRSRRSRSPPPGGGRCRRWRRRWLVRSRMTLNKHLDLARAERRGRLVHDQDAGVGGQGAGDLDDLLLADPQVLDQRAGRDRLLEPLHQLLGDLPLPGVVDRRRCRGPQLAADEDVVPHAEVRRRGSAPGG